MPTSGERRRECLVDTSVAVALSVVDHQHHDATRDALRGRTLGLSGHAWFETYSVLTRLPGQNRRTPTEVARLLAHNFPATRFLDVRSTERLRSDIVASAVAGGSVYDALVAATARSHSMPLVTRDRRATEVYRRLGVGFEILS